VRPDLDAKLSMRPRVVVLSSLFPHTHQPQAGLFVRERMFRVARHLPLMVVSPQPWFPGQRWLRRWKPGFRPDAPLKEQQQGHEVVFPRFFCVPRFFKGCDGWLMALGAWPRLRSLHRAGQLDLLDAHFAYPDGYAASLLAQWLKVPFTVTLRGTESRLATDPAMAARLKVALQQASHVFAVSESLRQVAVALGIDPLKVEVVGNGVDLQKFSREPKDACRAALGLARDGPVLVTVGGLVERKGFHRVMACLPALLRKYPSLRYLVVGGPSPEGDMSQALRDQCRQLRLEAHVDFLGPIAPDRLRHVLGAADVFVLSTRNEGWANVFLEAMACGLPVVTTDVGGNREVVCRDELGTVVAFGDEPALEDAIDGALSRSWDRDAIVRYAQANTWDRRVDVLCSRFQSLHGAAVGLHVTAPHPLKESP
jgi:teichuronic acid biosynthesis glycosyltransferase TuaC